MKIKQVESSIVIIGKDGKVNHILPVANTFFHRHPSMAGAILISSSVNAWKEREGISIKVSELTEVDSSVASRQLYSILSEIELSNNTENPKFWDFESYYPELTQLKTLNDLESILSWFETNKTEDTITQNYADGRMSSNTYKYKRVVNGVELRFSAFFSLSYRLDKPNLINYGVLKFRDSFILSGNNVYMQPYLQDSIFKNVKVYNYNANDVVESYSYKNINDLS